MATNGGKTGKLVEIKGVVVDAVFTNGLPDIYSAVRIPRPDGSYLIAEVQQHLGDDRIRAVAMDATDGIARGTDVDRHGRADLGAGRRRDARPRLERARRAGRREGGAGRRRGALVDPPRPARLRRPDAEGRDLRDRHQGDRPDRALRARRQDRPLRRRRRRQDGADPGADPQHRPRARRRVGLLRRRRAHARGQRPPARDDRVRGDRQGRALLRADERAAWSASARRPVRPDDGGVLPRPGPGRAALHRQHLPLRAGRLRGLGAARPHAERRRLPADARHRDGPAAGAHHVDDQGRGHVGAGDLRAGRRPHRPGAGEHVRAPRRDDHALARDRRAGHLPGRRPARLDLARAAAGHRLGGALHDRDARAGGAAALQGPAGHHRDPRHRGAVGRGPPDGRRARARSSASCRSRTSSPSSSPARRAST